MSTIRYKFVNAKDSASLLFEGVSLSTDALKRAIAEREHLMNGGSDLVITDTSGIGAFGRWGEGGGCLCRGGRCRHALTPPARQPPRAHAPRPFLPPCRAEFPVGADIPKNTSVLVKQRAPVAQTVRIAAAPPGGSFIPGLTKPCVRTAATAGWGAAVVAAGGWQRVACCATGPQAQVVQCCVDDGAANRWQMSLVHRALRQRVWAACTVHSVVVPPLRVRTRVLWCMRTRRATRHAPGPRVVRSAALPTRQSVGEQSCGWAAAADASSSAGAAAPLLCPNARCTAATTPRWRGSWRRLPRCPSQ